MALNAAAHCSTPTIDHLYRDRHEKNVNFTLHYGDLTDSTNLIRIMQEVQPDEVYNLAAQSHVKVSFETPEYTANADAIGTLRYLRPYAYWALKENEVLRASTSELYGTVQEDCRRKKPLLLSPKPFGGCQTIRLLDNQNYRESYGLYACNGILFNHESPYVAKPL